MPDPQQEYEQAVSELGGGIGGAGSITYDKYFSAYQDWLAQLVRAGVIDSYMAGELTNSVRDSLVQHKALKQDISQVAHQLPEFDILFQRTLQPSGQYAYEPTSSYVKQEVITRYTAPQKLARQQAEQEAQAQYELRGRREGYRSAYETQRAEAAARGIQAEPVEPTPPIPEPSSKAYREALEGYSPAMKQYFASKGEQVYGQFAEVSPGLRQAWWSTLNPQASPTANIDYVGMRRQELARLEAQQSEAMGRPNVLAFLRGEVGTEALSPYDQMLVANVVEGYNQGQPSALSRSREAVAADWASMEANFAAQQAETAANYVSGTGMMEYQPPTPEPVDPWLTYLKEYPFKEKFAELTPRQKGFYSGTLKPAARWTG